MWSIFFRPLLGQHFNIPVMTSCNNWTTSSSWEPNAASTEHPRFVHLSSLNWYLWQKWRQCKKGLMSVFNNKKVHPIILLMDQRNLGSRTDIKSVGHQDKRDATIARTRTVHNVRMAPISCQCINLITTQQWEVGFHANISFPVLSKKEQLPIQFNNTLLLHPHEGLLALVGIAGDRKRMRKYPFASTNKSLQPSPQIPNIKQDIIKKLTCHLHSCHNSSS